MATTGFHFTLLNVKRAIRSNGVVAIGNWQRCVKGRTAKTVAPRHVKAAPGHRTPNYGSGFVALVTVHQGQAFTLHFAKPQTANKMEPELAIGNWPAGRATGDGVRQRPAADGRGEYPAASKEFPISK